MRRLASRLLILGLLGLGTASCGGETPDAAAPSPATRRPAVSYLPADLDVVVRLDTERLRQELPPGSTEQLLDLSKRGAGDAEPAANVIAQALTQSQRLWLGLRPDMRAERVDGVAVLEGNFSTISADQRAAAFLPGRDLGNGWSVFDARSVPRRNSPARLYTYGDELWIVATQAELDAVERTVELGRSESGLEPAARGVVSVAVRMAPLFEQLKTAAPRAAGMLEHASLVTASADLRADGLAARVELTFDRKGEAERLERAVDTLVFLFQSSDRLEGLRELKS
ncbi:MAG TPA: hypothetical protein VLC09_20445, partial [Polyangiaceae bacterium]|nr:hypothetical protein [Polyangiaceae bacterium]